MSTSVLRRWSCRAAVATTVLLGVTSALRAQAIGSITGRVTDSDGSGPVNAAQVVVVGTRLGAATSLNGEYRITGVPAGAHEVRVVRIGYTPVQQQVTVTADGSVTLDFTMTKAATRLQEVVTTATGQMERKSFGNVVATIKTDSIAAVAPVTTVNELLQARTPGVQVIQGSGQTGTSSSIRIRGTSSLSLTNEPLIVVDGVRFDNGAAPGNTSTQRINRFSGINPEEIESMDVIKGPSAAALYGTAAANGVVVIRTRRGRAGRTQWTAQGEYGLVDQPATFDDNWRSWGQSINAAGQRIGAPNIQCRIANFAARTCVIDSLSRNNPLGDAGTSPYTQKPRYVGGLQASGGTDLLRFFVAGEREIETGPYEMPSSEVRRLTTERGKAPTERQINPNHLEQNTLRANMQLALAQNMTLDVSTGYTYRELYTPFDGGFFAGLTFQGMTGPGWKNATNGYQREFVGDIFSIEQKLTDNRLVGSAAWNYTPRSWLQFRATTGLDQDHSYNHRQNLRGEGPRAAQAWGPNPLEGGKFYDRSNTSRFTVDLGSTATLDVTPTLNSRTTVGLQWFKDEQYQGQGQGYNLPPGATTTNSAGLVRSFEFTTENATYGAFVEEQLGLRDRLFLTFGLRTDQNSAFGRSVGNTIYPRAAGSYVLSEEPWYKPVLGISRARVRVAYGKAGVQPGTTAAIQFLNASTFPADNGELPGLRLTSIGNALLKPEVTTELEGGFDLGLFSDRINVEATYFRKRSKDALFAKPLPPSYGAGTTQWVNLAAVENKGFELTIDANIVQERVFSWNLRLGGSQIKNKLLDDGDVALGSPVGARNVEGYPLFGLWDRELTGWNDANGDGILTDAEITVGADKYRGSTLPQREAGMNNTFGFFNNRLRVNALFDYRGQFWNQWGYFNQRCVGTGNCREVNDPKTPLEWQARAVAANSPSKRTVWGTFVENDFIRFRELSVAYQVPERLTQQYLKSRNVSIVFSGRNLGVPWTKYPGIDPETNSSVQNTGGGNNDFFSTPLLRYWITRVNIGF
ncbi:MAG: SusC/RagA family TonB-linked outer membrane protein [Gemmatimonadaceae bacterium]|nr:SusC/RagA family TonB-linked outer membrane protein [Gemmatimonadaceae bacterium]